MTEDYTLDDFVNGEAKHCFLGDFEHLETNKEGLPICDYVNSCSFQAYLEQSNEIPKAVCTFELQYKRFLDRKYRDSGLDDSHIIHYT